MRNKLIFISVFGAIIMLIGLFRGTAVNESDSSSKQNIALKNSIINYAGLIIVMLGTVGIILTDNK